MGKMTIGARIKYFRKQRAMTQEELSKKAGLGHNAVSIYERDEREISAASLKAISEALGVDPSELYRESDGVFFTHLDDLAYLPTRAHEEDAGYDLFAPAYNYLGAKSSTVINTGVHIAIPNGYAGLIVSKSGLNMKHGIISDGLIDSGYTGPIQVKLYNLSDKSYEIRPKDKISQIVFIPVAQPALMEVVELADTERGDNGFGSTGR